MKRRPLPFPRRVRVLLAGLLACASGFAGPGAEAAASEEFRGLWVDAFRPGFRTENEIRKLVADARSAGVNALFVQMRKRGDAYYASQFEPRATELAPGFDPLSRLLEVAHDETQGPRIAVHAWVVAFNVWNNPTNIPARPDHPYRRHPDWLTRSVTRHAWDGSNYAFDPGHPDVQFHTFDVVMDLVRRYPIDGLHWDYIRYAGREWGYNDEAVRRFNTLRRRTGRPAVDDPDWCQFRRDQVTALVRKVYLHARVERPELEISAATITFAPGIRTTAQWPTSAAYSDVLQDWRAWMEEGILDWNVPMAYFRQAEHASALDAWCEFVKDHQYRRRAVPGLGYYLNTASNALAQIALARRPSASGQEAAGVALFVYGAPPLDASRDDFFRMLVEPGRWPASAPFAQPARRPLATWKSSTAFGNLHGRVRGAQDRRPVDGARVRLTGPEVREITTDATGYFGAVDLRPGDYRVDVAFPGRDAAGADVSVPGGHVAALDFALTATWAPAEGAAPVPERDDDSLNPRPGTSRGP